mmetsp:Transcript_29588/g.71519  ORF Transcript_29588/g.71519 Transcript_29588/m.71519 type:complete len:117 (-) Transcript_29588:242-592(-)
MSKSEPCSFLRLCRAMKWKGSRRYCHTFFVRIAIQRTIQRTPSPTTIGINDERQKHTTEGKTKQTSKHKDNISRRERQASQCGRSRHTRQLQHRPQLDDRTKTIQWNLLASIIATN